MEPIDQLIGEIIAARSIAQMVAYAMVQNGLVPRDEIETRLVGTIAVWANAANGKDPHKALHAGVAAVRMSEFLEEFRKMLGGSVQ